MYRDQLSFSLIVLKVLTDWKQLTLGLHFDVHDTNSITVSFTVTWLVVFIVKIYVKRMSNFQPFVLLCRYYRPQGKVMFSLHIRSVWETICDALTHSSYQNFGFKIFWVVPPLKYLRNVVSRVAPPPNENLVRTTVVVGTHPTGMHSCLTEFFVIAAWKL